MMQSNNNNEVLNRLTNSLENLLGQIKESQTEFAAIRTELAVLHDNVKVLSRIVLDGDGNVSVITKVALLDQKINDVLKWQDSHDNWEQETHQRLADSITELRVEVEEIQLQVLKAESRIELHDKQLQRDEQAEQAAIDKKLEIAHAERLNNMKLQAERQKLILKIVGVVVAMLLTFLAGYLTNKQQQHMEQKNTTQHMP